MRKKDFFIFFAAIFYAVKLMAFSTPPFELFVRNEKNEPIYIDAITHPELINDYAEINGNVTYLLETVYGHIRINIFIRDNQRTKIKPMQEMFCYNFFIDVNRMSVTRWFESLGPYIHFNMIYDEFTINNENEKVLLDMAAMSVESFEKLRTHANRYYLVVK